ncbi:MAG: FmdB family transcriptional regulator [Chloroflexi bacterium]|nr:FmdB family transcriptional regulator [Chloroflexota bacterium]
MPTYEYQCAKCSNLYEKREGFDAPAQQKCPSCGGKAQRVIQAAPIVFKGSGFYKTDSRKAPPSEAAAASVDSSDSRSDDKGSSGDSSSTKDSSTKDTEAAAAS